MAAVTDIVPQSGVARLEKLNASLDLIYRMIEDVSAGTTFQGGFDPSSGSFPAGASLGDVFVVTSSGTVDGVEFSEDDLLVAMAATPSPTTYANNWRHRPWSYAERTKFRNLTHMVADRTLTYTPGGGRFLVTTGDIVTVEDIDAYLQVAPSAATDADWETLNGVKLYVRTKGFDLFGDAFGFTPGVGVDNTSAMQKMYDAAVRLSGIADGGGAPNSILPLGVIEVEDLDLVMTNNMCWIGQGMTITNTSTPSITTAGTQLVVKGDGALFYTGEPTIEGVLRRARNVQFKNFTITRHADFVDAPGPRGLFDGHGASKWVWEDIQIISGAKPGMFMSEGWDCEGRNVTISHSGQPDGYAAFCWINSSETSQDGNSNRWWDLRIEDSRGPAMRTEGNHHKFYAPKVHAPANSDGASFRPAISLGKNSLISGGQLVNFMPGSSGKTDVLLELAGEGASVADTFFRKNDGVQLIEVVGNDAFSGGGSIAGNVFESEGSGTYAILDSRTGSGKSMRLDLDACGRYSGAPGSNSPANLTAACYVGGTPPTGYKPGVYAYKNIGSGGAAIHARMANVNSADPYAFAGLFQSGNLGNAVGCFEQMRTSGNVAEVLRLATGLLANTGKKMLRVVTDSQGTPTEVFNIGIDGSFAGGHYASADIEDATHAVNTVGKSAGKTIRDTTNGYRFLTASGPADVDPWNLADGTVGITPEIPA